MKRELGLLLGGIGLGSGLTYFLDPNQGRRRRARIRDQAIHMGHVVGDGLDAAAQDLRNRTQGMLAETKGRLRRERVSDEVLIERARSAMGRAVSHPRAIELECRAGTITLRGPVLANEADHLISTLSRVRGVNRVESHLDIFQDPGDHPALQGGSTRPMRYGMLRSNWPPATRLLMGAVGGAMTAYGLKRMDPAGAALGLTGAGIITRAAANQPLSQVRGSDGTGAGQMTPESRKTQEPQGLDTFDTLDTMGEWEEDDRTHTSPMGDVLYDRIAA